MFIEKLMRQAQSCAPPGREVEESPQSCGCTAGSSPVRLQRTWFAHYLIKHHQAEDFAFKRFRLKAGLRNLFLPSIALRLL
jgi:hypothetical protein